MQVSKLAGGPGVCVSLRGAGGAAGGGRERLCVSGRLGVPVNYESLCVRVRAGPEAPRGQEYLFCSLLYPQ